MVRSLIIVLLGLLIIGIGPGLSAQSNLYDIGHIPEIRIYFTEANWDAILDSLYVAGDKGRLVARLQIDGTELDQVGVRYKGFSSVSTNRVKNPFNISLDYEIEGQEYQGVNKLKLGNVIQDPSFVREVLTYEIARKYMPASRANYAKVFVNDALMGLYTNVEAVNKDFLEAHFASRNLPFFKGNPDALSFNGGNSDLSDLPGTDTTSYYPFYQLKSKAGWTELYHLIDTLNNHTAHLEKVLNVDQALWMHAINYSLINFDSYIGYAQNYYLYRDQNGRWNPILWDLNMSFASFRFSDASLFWAGFTIPDAKTIDPLQHHNNVSVYARPLLRNLFANATYRRMYLAHMRTIMQENFASQDYAVRAQFFQNLIDSDVAADTNKFYSYANFKDNLTKTVSDLIDYPGITDLMDARNAYLGSYSGIAGAPTLTQVGHKPQDPAIGDTVWITARVADADSVVLAYRYGGSEIFRKIAMQDDGNQGDSLANDGIFGARLIGIGNNTQYYIYAENDSAGIFSPERAAFEYHAILPDLEPGTLVINEVMASNRQTAFDQDGAYDDWIELFNNADFAITTGGLFLSDNQADLKKWALPDVPVGSREFLIIWADNEAGQSGLHTNFQLDKAGDALYLSDAHGRLLDSLEFG
ncbi:MAG TPA: hypothetical protein ENJ82_08730, partial [Bacteroidetes bacterium]|nr:hypothetical protein [Bacteroidota bacterium]